MLLVKDNVLCVVFKWEVFFVEEKKRIMIKEDILFLEILMYWRMGIVVKVFIEYLGVVEVMMDIYRDYSCFLFILVMICLIDEYVLLSYLEIMFYIFMLSVL